MALRELSLSGGTNQHEQRGILALLEDGVRTLGAYREKFVSDD
jgi:hypothetical protein